MTTIEIPPSGTHGVRIRGHAILRLFNRLSVWMFRRLGSKARGRTGLLLTTVGSRSGKEHTVGLGAFPDGTDSWFVVGSLAGAARHPDWFFNLARNPANCWVEINNERFKVEPELLKGEERNKALARIGATAPGYLAYQEKTDRELPVVRLTKES